MSGASDALNVLRRAGMKISSDCHEPDTEEFHITVTTFHSGEVKLLVEGKDDTLHGTLAVVKALEDALETAKWAVDQHLPF